MASILDKNMILDAARTVFARHGYRRASLADIVRPLGVANTAVYHHFPGGKEEIFHAVITREEHAVLTGMEQGLSSSADPPRQLRALIMAKLTHFQQLRELLMVPRDVGEEVAQLYAAHETTFRDSERDMIAALLRKGQTDGIFRSADPEHLAKTLQNVLNRLEVPLVFEETPDKMEREIDDLLQLLLYGIMIREVRKDG
jgi:AcrR family transcriptional regulator